MTRQQSEGEVHVEAMRLILAEMERREDVPDWTIWQHMLNMLETIFQGIEDQRDDDRDELMHTRKDRDHWKQARDTAIEGGELLLKSNQALQAEAETLQDQLANAQRELSEQGQAHSVEQQQETADLREQLADAQRAVSDAFAEVNSVREQLDAAQAAVTLQRAGIERLSTCVGKVRTATLRYQPWSEALNQITAALAELDAATEPTPVAERCPECDGSGMVDSGGFGPDGKAINVPCGGDCSGGPCPSQPTPVAEQPEGGA